MVSVVKPFAYLRILMMILAPLTVVRTLHAYTKNLPRKKKQKERHLEFNVQEVEIFSFQSDLAIKIYPLIFAVRGRK